MTPQSNDDLDLSVYADWLEDEGRYQESQWVRESLSESTRKWEWLYRWRGVGSGVGSGGIGGGVGGGGGGVSVIGVALLPCSLLLMVLASARVCSVASVTESALITFVAKDLSGSNAI